MLLQIKEIDNKWSSSNIINNIDRYLLILISFGMPFGWGVLRFPVVAWGLFQIGIIALGHRCLSKEKLLLFPLLYFLISVYGFILFAPPVNDISVLERRVLFLIIPGIFLIGRVNIIHVSEYYKFFVFGNILAGLVNLCRLLTYIGSNNLELISFITTFTNENINQDGYRMLSFIHPSYFAMFNSFSIAILLNNKLITKLNYQVDLLVRLLGIIFLLLVIFILQSRAGILSAGASFVVFMIIKSKKHNARLKYILFTIVMLVILGYFMSYGKFKTIPKLVTNIMRDGLTKLDKNNKENLRYWIWYSSFELIKEKPIKGYGISNGEIRLINKYKEIGLEKAYKNKKLNAHNQYLQIWLESGVAGLIIMILMVQGPLLIAIKRKNALFLMFSIIMLIHLTFESMFVRIDGIAFFLIFFCLLSTSSNRLEW